nr:cytochrome P450 [Nocardia bovistercoris]
MDFHPDTLGGIQTAVAALRGGLERTGHRVTLFVAPHSNGAPHSSAAAPTLADVVELHASGPRVNDFPMVLPTARNDELIDAVFAARGPFDVVHTHTTYGVSIAGMKAARRHRVPLVHTAQSRDDNFLEHTSPAPLAAALALRAFHGCFVPHDRRMPRVAESRAARHAWRTIVGQAQAADHVIAPTRHFAQALLAHGLTAPLRVVSNGVDDELVDRLRDAAPEDLRTQGPLRLVWSGRLSAEKRPLTAVEAVRMTPGCTLDLFGEGDLRDRIRAVVDRDGLADRIRAHGRVPRERWVATVAHADVVLSTSHDFDTQGLVLLEAVAAGVPIVHCDPALAESVPEGGGVCAADPSAAALARTIAELDADRAKLSRMREIVAAQADSVRMSRQVAEVLDVYRAAARRRVAVAPMPRTLAEVPTAPGSVPFVGHSLRALRDAPGFVTSLSDLGPVVRIRFGRKTGYVLTTPDLVREVGLGEVEFNRDDLREAIEDVAGGSVNVLRGPEHKLRRRMIAPALRQSRLTEYTAAAADIAHTWAGGLPAGERVDLMDEAHGLILDTVSSTLFTADFSDEARRAIRDNVPWLLSQVLLRTALPPQVRRMRLIANYRWRGKARHLRGVIGGVVAEYRRHDEDFNDVVSALIRHTDAETGARLSDEHIIDEAILMLAAGVGSMASLAGWLWHEVMTRPPIAERLYAELDAVVGAGPVGPAHLHALPYLRQVVAETLRFWGTWISGSNADGDVTIGGLTIPAGAAVMFSPYMVQHDPRYYPAPETFDPDRWSPDRADDIDKKAILSFGVGRRRCLGDHFATLEITLASAALLARWRPVPDPGYVVRASNRDFVLSPSAIPVTLHPR